MMKGFAMSHESRRKARPRRWHGRCKCAAVAAERDAGF